MNPLNCQTCLSQKVGRRGCTPPAKCIFCIHSKHNNTRHIAYVTTTVQTVVVGSSYVGVATPTYCF